MLFHLGAEFAFEGIPGSLVVRALGERDEFGSWRENGQPDVVKVAFGELRFGDAARRTPDGADAQSLVGFSGSTEADYGDWHVNLRDV